MTSPEHADVWLWGLEAHHKWWLSPSSKFTSLSSCYWEVVMAPSSSRVNIPRNPGTMGSGAVATTPVMVSQVCFTGARFGACWTFGVPHTCAGAVGKAGAGTGGNFGDPCLVLVVSAWWDCVGACMSGAAYLVICWGNCCSLSAWTFKRATEDTRALMISGIW